MIALAETVWSPRSTRSWNSFNTRLQPQLALLRAQNIRYSDGSFHIDTAAQKSNDGNVKLAFVTEQHEPTIYYTTDGSTPTPSSIPYSKPFAPALDPTGRAMINAAIFKDGKAIEGTTAIDFNNSLALTMPYTMSVQPGVLPPYGAVSHLLTDGVRGNTNYFDGNWVAFNTQNLEIVVDLKQTRTIRSITTGFFQVLLGQSYSYLPTNVNYSVSSDGQTYTQVGALTNPAPVPDIVTTIKNETATFDAKKARYVKINASIDSIANLPPGLSIWMSVDEILVR
jgi:hexosaminidase